MAHTSGGIAFNVGVLSLKKKKTYMYMPAYALMQPMFRENQIAFSTQYFSPTHLEGG